MPFNQVTHLEIILGQIAIDLSTPKLSLLHRLLIITGYSLGLLAMIVLVSALSGSVLVPAGGVAYVVARVILSLKPRTSLYHERAIDVVYRCLVSVILFALFGGVFLTAMPVTGPELAGALAMAIVPFILVYTRAVGTVL
jgi:hypothetical protein